MPELRIIAGPTGAGKSALALRLAQRHGCRIISADSRQVYRGFDIGTAKPSREERAAVPQLGLDLAEPTERWNAARWAEDARGWIAEDLVAGRIPLVVGGTGLWLQALVRPLAAEPPLDPPGVRSGAQGLRQEPKAEFSVDDPIPNSSMFVFPMTTPPASRSLRTTVASNGERYQIGRAHV